uniref:Elicitin n=1 Tax=Achlya hypogyna TaxID=1202772 RepID=A0A0A7CM45_ACHHY|nr:secreted protein [Achlya hypogyna]
MKTSALVLAFASVAAAADPCSMNAIISAASSLIASKSLTTCGKDSGFDFTSIPTGKVPTADEAKKIVESTNCQALYAEFQKAAATITPVCSLGGIDTSAWSTTPITAGLPAIQKAFANLVPTASTQPPSGAGNSTTGNSTITTPSTGSKASGSTPTAAPTTKAVSSANHLLTNY